MKNFLLCYITDRRQLKSVSLSTVIREMLRAGVEVVQIREKDLATRELLAVVEEALKSEAEAACATGRNVHLGLNAVNTAAPIRRHPGVWDQGREGARIVVNDRLDVALAAGSNGVHLGGPSMPVNVVRRIAPRPFVIGASCHSLAEAVAAESAGADYLVLGPIFETPSKLAYGAPLGLEKLRTVTSRVRIPVLALGGITLNRVLPCLEAGAAGIAGIRIFQDCESVAERVRELRALG